MTIKIVEIHQYHSDKIFASIKHNENIFDAYVMGDEQELSAIIDENLNVEIDYKELCNWHKIDNFHDVQACICKSENNSTILIRGIVHNLVKIDENTYVVDLYLRDGPEFISVDTDEIGGMVPLIGEGFELEVSEIYFYPVYL